MHNPGKARRYNFSGIGCGNDIDSDIEDDFDDDDDDDDENNLIVSARDSDGKVVVRKMCLKLF